MRVSRLFERGADDVGDASLFAAAVITEREVSDQRRHGEDGHRGKCELAPRHAARFGFEVLVRDLVQRRGGGVPGSRRGDELRCGRRVVGCRHGQPGGRPLEVGAHVVRALVALEPVLGERLQHDRVDVARDRRLSADGGVGISRTCGTATETSDVADERRLSGEQLVEHTARGVEVAAGVGLLAASLLGREVLRGADRPRRSGSWSTPLSASARAMPKSMTLTSPVWVIITLPGLMSRWMMPVPVAELQRVAARRR